MDLVLSGGELLRPEGLGAGDLAITGGIIASAPAVGARRLDARGLLVLPGIIDVHGDGFERNISPRAGVDIPLETALLETDRQLVANGITTAFLGLTISWEPGLRSLESARAFMEAYRRLRPHFRADIRIQLRWEIFALDAVEDVRAWLACDPRPVLAFNDHMTGMMTGGRHSTGLAKQAARSGLAEDAFIALAERVWARRDEVPAAVERLASAAAGLGVPCFAHDECEPAERERHRGLGIRVSEFPMTHAVAEAAVAAGEPTVLGAPNVLRGGSHIGALDAEPAARAGLCTALASDYYYPAPLAAAARLVAGGVGLADAWSLISAGAALATGLGDRGQLAPGQRADVLMLRRTDVGWHPVGVITGGRLAMLAEAERLG